MRVNMRKPQGSYKAGWQDIVLPPQPRFIGDFAELARALKTGKPLKHSYDHELLLQETLLRASGKCREPYRQSLSRRSVIAGAVGAGQSGEGHSREFDRRGWCDRHWQSWIVHISDDREASERPSRCLLRPCRGSHAKNGEDHRRRKSPLYKDYQQLLASDIDAVIIATPVFLHAEHFEAALSRESTSTSKSPLPRTLKAASGL